MGFIGVLLHFLGLGICLLGLTWRKKRLVAGTVMAIGGFLIGTSPFWLVPYIPYETQSVEERSATQDQSATHEQHRSTPQEAPMSLEALDDVLEQTEVPTEATSDSSEHSSQEQSPQKP